MRNARRRIEPHVVTLASPEVAFLGQQVEHLDRRLRREATAAERKLDEPVLYVERIEVHHHQEQIRAIGGPLAVAEQLRIVRLMELESPVVLQRRMVVAD